MLTIEPMFRVEEWMEWRPSRSRGTSRKVAEPWREVERGFRAGRDRRLPITLSRGTLRHWPEVDDE